MSQKAGLYIVGDVPQPSNYTRIPNMAIEQLGAYAFKLLAILMGVARTTEKCWMSNKAIAKKLGCSVNSMKKARTELVDKGYILVEDGTELNRANVTILFRDIWKMNDDTYTDLNPKPEGGVSKFDTPLSWDDNPLSKFDTLTKQDIVTIQENKETTPPIPPVHEKKQKADVSTPLQIMTIAVRQIKAYGDTGERVAKTLLNLHDEPNKNAGGKAFTPEDIPKFVAWWQAKYPDLTIPRNSQSCVKWFNIWRDETETVAKPIVREVIRLEQPLDNNTEFMRQFMQLPKVAGNNHHG